MAFVIELLLIGVGLSMAAVTLTASSGKLVPIATIVIPMIKDGTLNFFATEELPSTK